LINSLTNRWKNARLIQIPFNSSDQAATVDGLAIELRQMLLTNALQTLPTQVITV